MARTSRIMFDKTEIVCIYRDAEAKLIHRLKSTPLPFSSIQAVSIKPCRERKGLKVVESERIIIRSKKLPRPIESYKIKERKFFDEYKAGLRLFCKQNKIKLIDEAK